MDTVVIDSMLWIYYYDPNAPENPSVTAWFDNHVVDSISQIVINPIIPMEVMHNFGKHAQLSNTLVYNLTMAMLALKKVKVVDLDLEFFETSLDTYTKYRKYGIGGRDASVIALLENSHAKVIATHDKNILSIPTINRIDPVFERPLVLTEGETFEPDRFSS